MRSDAIEVGDIFRQFGTAYQQEHKLALQQLKVMTAIEKCRTQALGGHIDMCDECGYERISYNSCCNRHCPKCQSLARERWVLARQEDLLPICYFHIVFTLPDELNRLCLVNQKVMYDLLFRAGSETILDLGKDAKHIGGKVGFICVLHTWGQNLMDHPHLHCIVTGGGLSNDGTRWLEPKKTTPKKDFFVHVNVISDLFKKKFLAYLKQAYQSGKLKFVGEIESLADSNKFQELINKLYNKKWNSYCKKPFGGPEKVLTYLGRYSHRVAIANHRIVKLEDSKVTFKWRDYRDGNKNKLMTINAFEFIRRFLLHILPKGYFKIRYYGLLASRNHRTDLELCKRLLKVADKIARQHQRLSWEDLMLELFDIDVRRCPVCGKGRLVPRQMIPWNSHAPP
jgi:predicted Zn-ribbon and HTH transcriptional regulator